MILFCGFCGANLIDGDEVEVDGLVFETCSRCAETVRKRLGPRPRNPECCCPSWCEIHEERPAL